MNTTWKRWGALLLALVMALSLLPTSALAARLDGEALPAVPVEDIQTPATPAVIQDDVPASLSADSDVTADYDGERNIDVSRYTLCVPSENARSHSSEGPQRYAIDNNMGTFWHSDRATAEADRWIAIELDTAEWVSAFRYRPRSDTTGNALTSAGNGIVAGYRIEISNDELDATTLANTNSDDAATRTAARAAYAALTWTPVAEGTWNVANESGNFNGSWQVANFTAVRAKRIRLVGVTTRCNSDKGDNTYMHAAEIRVVAAPEEASYTVSGTVTDGTSPLEGAVVTIGGATATTNAQGEYSVTLRAGEYSIAVTLEGYQMTAGGTVTVTDANVTGHTVTMAQVQRAITGTVTDGEANLEGATVTLVNGAAPYATVAGVAGTTDEDGAYRLNVNSLPAGTYRVRAAKAGYGAALSGEVTVATGSTTQDFVAGQTVLTAIGQTTYAFDMTTQSPTYTTGSSTAARLENGGLFMNFSGADRTANQVKLSGVSAADLTVEFDAVRGGSGVGGFGVALRCAGDSSIYVGQDATASGWRVNDATATPGPSFAAGDTRHFKVTLGQAGDSATVSLWIDGVSVLTNVAVSGAPTAPGTLAFVCGVNSTEVTVDNLYITNADPVYTITMPETLKGYVVLSGAQDQELPAGSEEGTFTAHAGDMVNIYSAAPEARALTAPLKVYKTADNTLSSTENTLRVPHNTSAHKERGSYIQFRMPAYPVTLEATLDASEAGAVSSVSILRASEGPAVVNVDGYAALQATLTPARNVPDEGLAVTWTSSDPDVVTVTGAPRAVKDAKLDGATASATLTGVSAGTATITITTANGLTDTREVTVGTAVTNVIFEDTQGFTLSTNGAEQTKQLTPTVNPTDASIKTVTWWSTDETVATVDANGLVTAVAPGTAKIYVRSTQNPAAQAYREVTVVTLPKTLKLSATQVELFTNPGDAAQTQTIVPTFLPAGTSEKTVVWTTSNSAVATVTKPWAAETGSQNALITAQGVGTATITAKSAADQTVTATVTVIVKQKIVGQAAVSGELKFGSELTADINGIVEAAKDGLSYQWYRGETASEASKINGAIHKTYTPVQADIGSKLTVKVTASGSYVGETTYTTPRVIEKADGEPMKAVPKFTNVSAAGKNDGEITGLFKGRKYEYKKVTSGADDPGETGWTAFSDLTGDETGLEGNFGTAKITGLGEGTYVVRRAGDDCHKPGAHRTVTIAVQTAQLVVVNNPQTFEGGLVTVGRTQIPEGDTVRLTVKPDTGYELVPGSLKATPNTGAAVVAVADETTPGRYTFTMPRNITTVTISAQFRLKTYTIVHALTNITCNMDEHHHTATHGEAFSIVLAPVEGFDMPRELTVTETATGQKFTDFTYTAKEGEPEKRVLNFTHGVTASVTVRGEGTRKTFPVEYVRSRVSFTSAPTRAGWHQAFVAAVRADAGYQLPETITVTMDGEPLEHTYNQETGAVYIAEGLVEGSLTISVTGEKPVVALEKVSISGVAQVGQRLTANITPAQADGSVTFQWYWATLDADGNVTAEELITNATGRSRVVTSASLNRSILVKATAVNGSDFSGTVTSRPTGTVIDTSGDEVLPTQVQIKRAAVSVEVGGVDTLVAYVGPANATNKTVLWSTSDPAVVTVEDGVITGVAPGTATVTVRTQADETVTDSCQVTVTAPRAVQATAEDVAVDYDGLPHSIHVLVTEPTDASASVTYSVDGVHFNPNNPSFSAVGEHVVWYQVTADAMDPAQGQAKVTIARATPPIRIAADRSSLSTGGTVTLTVTLPDYVDPKGYYVEASDLMLPLIRQEDGTYTVELPNDRKTYTFTLTVTGTDNYAQTSASCTVRVGPSSSGSTSPTKTETKPDGSKVTTVTQPDGAKTVTVTTKDGEEVAKVDIPATIPAPADKFIDMDMAPWAEKAVNNVAGLKLVEGIGGNKYDPVAPMTRGSLATVLHRLSSKPAGAKVTFNDVADGKFYTEGVAWAAKVGVVTGISADVFAPEKVITREQLAVMLARYADLIGLDTKADAKTLDQFADGAETGSWATEGVAWCVKTGILQGKGQNNLDPTTNVTRAEVAVMLDRFIALIK